jgi:hypothetical protein
MPEDNPTTVFLPPYMSWATFESIVDGLAVDGMPDQVDRSVLQSRSGGDQSQFLRAAGNFGLIDADGVPTDRLKVYATRPEQRPTILREILDEHYADVIALGTGATQQQLVEQFREFNIEGETVRKAIAFYLNAARQAEIPLSPRFKSTRPGAGGRKGSRRTARKNDTNDEREPGQTVMVPTLHPAILTLTESLPEFEEAGVKPEFSAAERKAWFDYAKATFNLIYAYPQDDEPAGDA